MMTEPVEGTKPAPAHTEQLGGTRHFSAAQFIQDQRDAVALVASQDGRFTIFQWSQSEQIRRTPTASSLPGPISALPALRKREEKLILGHGWPQRDTDNFLCFRSVC